MLLHCASPRRALLAGAALICAPALAHADVTPPPATVSGVVVQGQTQATAPGQPLSTTSIGAGEIARTVNAVTIEDAIKYLPSLVVRRRHIGDTQAPLATRTSGVGASARSLIYADGVLLSALIGNNNTSASPRWSMVSPDEVERIEVHYGPFSAAYPGNSIGAVVDIITRKPATLEGELDAGVGVQRFSLYGTKDTYPTYQASGSVGDRRGDIWWRASFNHLDSEGQPLSLVTATRPASPSAAGQAVSGGYADLNRTGQAVAVLGAGGVEHQQEDNAKLKLGWEITPHLEATYLVGYFGQDNRAGVQSYLADAAGNPVYAGALNIGGYAYSVAPSAFASGLYTLKEEHWMQALSLRGDRGEAFSWQATATAYHFDQDEQRTPSALPAGLAAAPGSILDLSGTGWRTFDAQLRWQANGSNTVRAGAHLDRYVLSSHRWNAADWRDGPATTLAAASLGKTQTAAAFVEDTLRLSPTLDATLGARFEHWRAFDGLNLNQSPASRVSQPTLKADRASPKAVIAWRPDKDWRATASAALAYRFPTVGELYQSVTTGPNQFVPDPTLKPERAISTELAVERHSGKGLARLSLFTEDIDDALLSQAGTTPFGTSVSFVQNVGHVRSRGAEAVVQAADVLVDGLDLSGSLTYVESEITRDAAFPAAAGKRAPQLPRLRWSAVASWRASERLTLTGAARYSDRSYGTLDNSDPISHTYQGFEGYLVMDLRATYRLDAHWSAALGVDNVGGRSYFLFHPFPQRSALAEIKYVY
jgi:iron complex outermembrane receptor protein